VDSIFQGRRAVRLAAELCHRTLDLRDVVHAHNTESDLWIVAAASAERQWCMWYLPISAPFQRGSSLLDFRFIAAG
jgi:hypothetical protein